MKDYRTMDKATALLHSKAAQARVSELEEAERAEENADYLGRCFKYRNSYSCPSTPSDYWWMYTKVIEVKGAEAFTFEFQTDKYGDLTINPRKHHYRSVPNETRGYVPIKASEYNAAWRAVQKRIAGWKP